MEEFKIEGTLCIAEEQKRDKRVLSNARIESIKEGLFWAAQDGVLHNGEFTIIIRQSLENSNFGPFVKTRITIKEMNGSDN